MSVYRCSICNGPGHNALTCGRRSKTQRPINRRVVESLKPRVAEPMPLARVRQMSTAPGMRSSWLVVP